MNPQPATNAGAAAQTRFESLPATRHPSVRREWPRIMLLTVSGMAMVLAMPLLGSASSLLAVVALLTAALGVVTAVVTPPDEVRAGSASPGPDRRTAEVLTGLEADGFRVLRDVRIPESRATIDHVVVGPTGVYVVDGRSWSGAKRIGDGMRLARRRSTLVERVQREADAVAVALPGTQVTPIICVHRADPPLHPLEVDGVRVVGAKALLTRLREGPVRLGLADIDRLTTRLGARLSGGA